MRPAGAVTEDRVVVGSSIRSTRLLKSLTLRDLAEQAGCSESLLSKIENDRISPSLSTLQRIARALDVSVASLVSQIDPIPIVARGGAREAVPIDRLGSWVERLVLRDGEPMLEGHLHVLQPGAGPASAIAHHGEEVGYVVDGSLELTVGSETFVLRAGDSFNFRSEIPHRYRNPGSSPTRIVWVSTPSRRAGQPGKRSGSSAGG